MVGHLLDAHCVVVVGSVARGDFNRWSDIDVLVVAENLPDTLAARLARLTTSNRPPGVEAILWTPDELAERWSRGNDPWPGRPTRWGIEAKASCPIGALRPSTTRGQGPGDRSSRKLACFTSDLEVTLAGA